MFPRATSLTVALCTFNHKERLRRTLLGLAQLTHPTSPWELLIVDNASTDGTSELVAAAEWRSPGMPVRVVRETELGLSNARNRAIRDARGEYIVFIDDDESPDPGWLTAYERVILAERPDALGGRIEVMFVDGNRPSWLHDEVLGFLGRLDHGGPSRRIVDPKTPIFGGNFAFRREVFERIGFFDATLGRKGTANDGGEDTEMYRRMIDSGCNVWWVPEAVIHHRIEAGKLQRRYFLDLHFRQGRAEGHAQARGRLTRSPALFVSATLARRTSRAGAAK